MADVCVHEDEDMSELDEETLMLEAAYENSVNFLDVWNASGNVDDFLWRDEYISVRPTCVYGVEAVDCLKLDLDVDGIVIEWRDVGSGLESNFTHLQVDVREINIRGIYSMLKKHLDLTKYKTKNLKVLRSSVGFQMMYDGGWETWLGLIPCTSETFNFDMNDMKRMMKTAMGSLKCVFSEELKGLLDSRVAMRTLAKNNINDISKMFVLPDDRRDILHALQRALDALELVRGFEKIVFTFRFGEKSSRPVDLPICDFSAVTDISVHVGCNVSSEEYDVFWSRTGLQEVVGGRGSMTTALSFSECANFQSNLDGRCLDISSSLRSVGCGGEIRFVQLYSDVAHRYPNSRMHPVSGSVIMLKGLGNALAEQSLLKDAQNYMSTIESNLMQFTDGICRLEVVYSVLGAGFNEPVALPYLIHKDRVLKLLEDHPLLVAYMKDVKIMDKLQAVGRLLIERLLVAYRSRRGTGDIECIWECFQSELALEKLLWGHPLCSRSNMYAINLGPGVSYPSRSVTDRLGFLGLNHAYSCCSDEESLPPLSIFSENVHVQRQLRDVSGIVNVIGASSTVLGRKVIVCLIKDLYVSGRVLCVENEFLLMLKTGSGNSGKRIVGRISLSDLTSQLCSRVKTRFPMAFESVMNLIRSGTTELETTLKNGIIDLGLGYFPAFRMYDQNRHSCLSWKFNFGFWVISDVSDIERCTEGEAAEMQGLVLSEMEKLKLCHPSAYREMLFPWLKPVLLKIGERKLGVGEKVQVLTFVSCLALQQQGRFIDFRNLAKLVGNLAIGQRSLIDLEVQSKLILSGVSTVRLHRLHPSIPFKLTEKDTVEKENTRLADGSGEVAEEEYKEGGATERIDTEDDNASWRSSTIDRVAVRHYAVSRGGKVWSQREVAILMEVADMSGKSGCFEKYQAYQRRCHEECIPDRSFTAFRLKLFRLRGNEI